eukprot:7383710-Prymnesium_polylepis.2
MAAKHQHDQRLQDTSCCPTMQPVFPLRVAAAFAAGFAMSAPCRRRSSIRELVDADETCLLASPGRRRQHHGWQAAA